ncbi:MAG: SAM-dependent methyltransferase [Ignavibacteriaceae bacterium]|nr:SAM-dependent methyltransferase [Ignavibacteriaceae bacterium]
MSLTEITQIQETTLYPILVEHLRSIGIKAIGETKTTSGSRPDILFRYKKINFVIEVKIGNESVSASATAQAFKYAQKLNTNNIIVLIFPESIKNQTSLFEDFFNDSILNYKIKALILSEFWTESLETTSISIFAKLKEKLDRKEISIDFNTVVNLINEYVRNLSQVVFNIVNEQLIDEVVNKLDLFSSIGEIKDLKTAQTQVMNLSSFLLFNQILFYHIFTKKNKTNQLPPLEEVSEPSEIQKYFDAITEIDYKAIYKVNILGHIPNYPDILKTVNDIILAIKSLRAEHITHDLAGRFFHDLIPFEVRKVLAAFYTHPNAADLLAELCISSYDDTVIDPACGSGTLLVASYKQKQNLYKQLHGFNKLSKMHKQFIEKDITGIDLMPFAAHISTINLTMQNIEQTTNEVRIATRDSLDLASPLSSSTFNGEIDIQALSETIQEDLFKVQVFEQKKIKKGALSPEGKGEGFKLHLNDVCIMNPPFSDREKMPKYMQDKLKANNRINIHSGNLVNLWGYFLVLGDMLLKENGILGAVIPINFARGKATEKIRDYIISNHTIKYIIKPVGDMAFSEGAVFKDILLITKKQKPTKLDKTKIVFLKETIKQNGNGIIEKFSKKIRDEDSYFGNELDIHTISRLELEENMSNLMHLLWANSYNNYSTIKLFFSKFSSKKLIDFPNNFVFDCYNSAGFRGLIEATFITNPMGEKSRAERAYMILSQISDEKLFIRIKKSSLTFSVPLKNTKKGLRTITGVKSFNIQHEHDYFISKIFPDLKEILRHSKVDNRIIYNWAEVEKRSKDKFVHLFIARRFRLNSPNTSFIAFFSDDKIISADVFKIIPDVSKTDSKILCLYFNSIFNIVQILTNREATTGEYSTVRETDLLEFKIIDYKNLSKKEKQDLIKLFEKLKKLKFPSFMDQIKNRFEGRVELDKAILKAIGFNRTEINEYLPRLYDIVLQELTEKNK